MAVKKKNEPVELTGPRKAAILMLSMGEERAAQVFGTMDDFEIRDISREMAILGQVSSTEMEQALQQFAESVGGGGGAITGGWSTTERYLRSFLKEDRVSELMDEMRGPAGRTTWEQLANVSEDILANYLQNEYPQTVAIIIERLRPSHAARVFATLPEDFALEVMERMILMDNVSREMIESVEDSLRSEFMRNLASKNKRDSHELMADIFNNLDRAAEAKYMELLESKHAEDAEKIRALMFTFEDIIRTNDAGIQTILRDIDKDKLALALKGASEEINQRILENMSERAAKILKEDMDAMGPVRVKDVDEAQNEIVVMVKKLVDEGKVVMAEEGGEDEFI